jgi:hypothetical protein
MAMSLIEDLNRRGATPETLLAVMTSAVFELSGDLDPAEMREKLEASIGEAAVDRALASLRSNPKLVGEVALGWLATTHADPESRRVVEAALSGADKSLVLIETAAATLVTLYAIYAIARIPKRKIRMIERDGNGAYRETEDIEYDSFSAPVRGLLGIFVAENKREDEKDGGAV